MIDKRYAFQISPYEDNRWRVDRRVEKLDTVGFLWWKRQEWRHYEWDLQEIFYTEEECEKYIQNCLNLLKMAEDARNIAIERQRTIMPRIYP